MMKLHFFQRYHRLLLFPVVAVVLSSCQLAHDLREVADKLETLTVQQRQELPKVMITKFSDSLRNLDFINKNLDKKPLYIAIEPIENKTAEAARLPSEITMMVTSALAKIGQSVNVIPYEDYAVTDKLQNGHNVYIIHGAITEFDANIRSISGGGNAGIFGRSFDADGGTGSSSTVSTITIDFTVLDIARKQYISGLQVSNTMKVHEVTIDNDIGFSIVGNGFGISASASEKQGVHSVLRLLVELSMVETIGKIQSIPYWLAIFDANPDKDMLDKLSNEFNYYSTSDKLMRLQELFKVYDPYFVVDGVNGPLTTQKILKYKKTYGLTPLNAYPTNELYVKLLSNLKIEHF